MEFMKIFDEKFHEIVKSGIRSILLENEPEDVENSILKDWLPEKPNSLACSYCRVEFDQVCQQREHYKLDWHRYNLRQSLLQKPPITEEEFDEKTTHDDISSISGSDSEKDDNLDSFATAQGKIFLQNEQGTVFSIYACLLYRKKEELQNQVLKTRLKECCVSNRKWAVLMLGGGHFAGAVFDNDQVVVHKTFHCYTVRAGQGGAQSSRDAKSGGSGPKSAGASLRRYNEQALVQHVRGIVDTWKSQLDECALILYRASGPYNRGVLFGGGDPVFDKNDARLRTIPFSTRRATFTEVKRVHSEMTTAQVYHSYDSAIQYFTRRKNTKRVKTRSPCIDRAKSREIIERPLPVTHETSSDEEVLNLSTENNEISFVDSLQEFEDTLTPEQRRKRKPKKSKTKQNEQRKHELIQTLQKGDIETLARVVNDFNEIVDDDGNTLLHIAAMNEQNATLSFLLEKGANPCAKNHKQQTPYTCTQSKEIRESLKQFARDFPDKYNYNKAQIPTNVLTPEELAEKKKAQRKLKKEKEKIKKKENEIKRREEMEKERFLKLSDREKRALAAERRILSQSGTVITRCFLCACDMTGKVPFEYLGNRFCSVECLKAHRLQNPQIL
ncbi:tRNA endonuclease ANKZF1 [Tribolium castaneum]|uniref:Protein vms-1-like Protein n=1 Tax=Tribolium castaneum TaxID=7070 RepID=D6WVQ0_TRICA|nr:PREDICTED: ankyrin repeat and zinc finger domain-containing protein 1 [Tribolium castaneum]EFA08600.1 Protein vms-1-like Protein [Tribolium castaneum]|eukprot:XP_966567.1 PREDICTED: ankyrin repeat and zinc finger domain-containing protein 1 [Tribolium castaneum]